MSSNHRLEGREERRLPIMMEVKLAPVANGEQPERTFTDNISPHGVRVVSTNARRPGEELELTPVKGEPVMLGEVVYCQKVDRNRFFVGLKFLGGPIPWSMLQRFNGLVLTGMLGAMRWKS